MAKDEHTTQGLAWQDRIRQDHPGRRCYGCGADNPKGLHLKSHVQGDELVAHWRAQEHHLSYPGFLNGGVAATLMDCHAVCAAFVAELKELGLDPGEAPQRLPAGWTKAMSLEFIKPVPLSEEISLRAKVVGKGDKSRQVQCSLYVDGQECVTGDLTIIMIEPA